MVAPRPGELPTLLDAFNFCDPGQTGVISDKKRFQALAPQLTGERSQAYRKGGLKVKLEEMDQDGNGSVNFAEFVEWAQEKEVPLPLGVPAICFPPTWTGRTDCPTWNLREVVEDESVKKELQALLNATYKNRWTRDRKATGKKAVPDGFHLVRALRREHHKDWRMYHLKRQHLVASCGECGLPGNVASTQLSPSQRHPALTGRVKQLYARHGLREDCNEWLLFHGTNVEAAQSICDEDFSMRKAGSASGTLYGNGCYFADSITKADEYCSEDQYGLCCTLVCRVLGGRVLYTDEATPNAEKLQKQVEAGQYNSILGDREKCRGTFKEYVVFDADQVYIEYLLLYRRAFNGTHAR